MSQIMQFVQWPQVKDITKKSFDGRTYYMYEANASYGTLGPHTLTAVTTKVGPAAPHQTTVKIPACVH